MDVYEPVPTPHGPPTRLPHQHSATVLGAFIPPSNTCVFPVTCFCSSRTVLRPLLTCLVGTARQQGGYKDLIGETLYMCCVCARVYFWQRAKKTACNRNGYACELTVVCTCTCRLEHVHPAMCSSSRSNTHTLHCWRRGEGGSGF
jgi:hypothetical protein